MEKEDVIKKLKELKSEGITYKYIAKQCGLTHNQIYDFIAMKSPALETKKKLEKYLTKGEF